MGICKIEGYRYECDRCGATKDFDVTDGAKNAGWLPLPPIEGVAARVLCPVDASKLIRFLTGGKTPAAARFNVDEQLRWEDSCT